MALFGVSKTAHAALQEECEALKNENILLKEQQNPTYKQLEQAKEELSAAARSIEKAYSEIQQKNDEISSQAATLKEVISEIEKRKKELVQLDDEILYQEFGLYKPLYSFAYSEQYKSRLDAVRDAQKEQIKKNTACLFFDGWTVNGSKTEGKKMTNGNIKQILRCFNAECENAIDRVKYNNIDSMKSRIEKSYSALNKLNQVNKISISQAYFDLKIEELHLSIEYAMKKQGEKEAQKQAREDLREQQKLDAEIKEAREKITKERNHFARAISDIDKRLETANETEKPALLEKRDSLVSARSSLDEQEKEIDYREKNAKAGYVYIISNIGSFGENIYKIGMTRRLEPTERIDELGDASVPFNFDIHALIFSSDAPVLEAALHHAFESEKINMVNGRREFFHVTLDEIKNVVKENFDETVDFVQIPPAEQYRESLLIKKVAHQ